ncbi:hypothetical protein DMA10_07235 [Streptomyces sp. WAC 01420]|uniref:hypothetical protein n=2 Tax=unclassified Streptomyces TaxID=2593676 RepID=UPI000F715B3C|nr:MULTISPECIES: hypothetical protein [unclassified Streptomyces]AZM64825.1 hypothetical protein DLM49_28655 [Streptomyces sp. WAC 01438]RSM99342.1 hypothetical protein DMA10_07235 [Streptomyces sp. WAC 01420]
MTLMVNRYVVTETLPDGSDGRVLAFAEQKRMTLKERMEFYTDESRKQLLCTATARQVVDLGAVYDVRDDQERLLGTYRKKFGASLLRSTWELEQPGSVDAVGRERNRFVAVVRRVWDFLPFDLVPFVWPYHFDFTSDGGPVMKVDKKIGLRDRYVVDVASPALDLRLAIAQAVALDALQSR